MGNSFHRVVNRSLYLDNSFFRMQFVPSNLTIRSLLKSRERIAIRENGLSYSGEGIAFRENGLSNSRERNKIPWERILSSRERSAQYYN